MGASDGWLSEELERRGVSRRDFVQFCAGVAAYFALPKEAAAEMADAVEGTLKPSLVWLEFQDCAGNTESLLRASRPTVAEVILDSISLDYHETIMAAAGKQAEDALQKTMQSSRGQVHRRHRGLDPDGRRRSVLHHRRQERAPDRARGL